MKTVSVEFYTEKIQGLETTVRKLYAFILLLSVALCYSTVSIYQSRCLELATEAKIQSFKISNQEELEIWMNERKDLAKYHEWKGHLRHSDAKKALYYDSKIEELKVRKQAINLLEIKLSTP